MSVNKVIIVGRLGSEPELKYTPSGTGVCNFSVATSESWTDKTGQKQEKTEWHRIVVWGKLGELCNQYLAKGRQVFLEGSVQTRSWEGNDGKKNYTTEIIARNVQFLGGNANAGAGANTSKPAANNNDSNFGGAQDQVPEYQVNTDANFTADDIPF